MPTYEVVYEGRVREIYIVEADSEQDARENWYDYTNRPVQSEVFDGEVVEVNEEEED